MIATAAKAWTRRTLTCYHLDMGVGYLYGLVGQVHSEEFAREVATEWQSAEMPGSNLKAWITSFRIAAASGGGYVTDTDDPSRERRTIWRGETSPRYARGMSWTLDRDRAEWFARRFAANHGSPRLYEAVIERDAVLGYFTGRA